MNSTVSILRKPLTKTVAQTVLSYSTGGLNIDGTRVKTSDNLNGGAYAENGRDRWDGADNWRYKRTSDLEYTQPYGRWPANIILSHKPDCEYVGSTQVKVGKATNSRGWGAGGDVALSTWVAYGSETYGDENGLEEIPVYNCVIGCPVETIDSQSGYTISASTTYRSAGGQHGRYSPLGDQGVVRAPGDSGGASRYFKVFVHHAEDSENTSALGTAGSDPAPAAAGFGAHSSQDRKSE